MGRDVDGGQFLGQVDGTLQGLGGCEVRRAVRPFRVHGPFALARSIVAGRLASYPALGVIALGTRGRAVGRGGFWRRGPGGEQA